MSIGRWLQVACLFATAIAKADDFSDALAAYDAGKFADARRGFERVVAAGASANAFYNLGNSCFRLDEHGASALAYERALVLDPGFSEALANLRFVREKARARVAEPDWRERVMSRIHPRAVPWLALGAAWSGWMLAGAGVLRRRASAVICGGVFAGLAAALFAGLLWNDDRDARLAVVVNAGSEARIQPADRAPVAEVLPAASRVRVISAQGGWTYCDLPGGGQGWVHAGHIAMVRMLPRK